MGSRLLIENGYVLSMDDAVGELPAGDVLIEDGRDRRRRRRVDRRADAESDRRRAGSRDARLRRHAPPHLADAACAAICADWTLMDYFRGIRMTISPDCTADGRLRRQLRRARSRRSTPASRRSSTSRTATTRPEHADAALAGPARRGHPRDVRLRLLPGAGAPSRRSPTHDERLADARRIREREHFSSDDALRDDGRRADRGRPAAVRADDRRGRARRASSDVPLRAPHRLRLGIAGRPRASPSSTHHGLLGPDQVHVHCNTLDERDFAAARGRAAARSPRSPRPSCRWGWATR